MATAPQIFVTVSLNPQIQVAITLDNTINVGVSMSQTPILGTGGVCTPYDLIDGGAPGTIYTPIDGFNLISGGTP